MAKYEKDCIFCKVVKGEIPSTKTYEDDNFIGILDIHPKAPGHTVIIPKKHFRTIVDMPSSLGNEMLDAIKGVGLKLIKEGKNEVQGFNVFVNNEPVAGQVVMHAHIHVVPRKPGDGLKSMA